MRYAWCWREGDSPPLLEADKELTERERMHVRDAGEEPLQPPAVRVQRRRGAASDPLGQQERLDGPAQGVSRGFFRRFGKG